MRLGGTTLGDLACIVHFLLIIGERSGSLVTTSLYSARFPVHKTFMLSLPPGQWRASWRVPLQRV